MRLQDRLVARRTAGSKLLIPYVTAGLPVVGGDSWIDVVHAVVEAGADAVEVGLPFSDPVMDGPVIQEASRRALRAGTTPRGVLAALSAGRGCHGAPLAVMTYFNIVHSYGLDRFAAALSDAGVGASIVPDLPLDEAGPWISESAGAGVETVLLAAPTTPDERLKRICEASTGFVYGVGLMGVTGTRESLSASALTLAVRLKEVTDKPVLIGVGVSDARQACEACTVADGVVIGSALIRVLLDDGGTGAAAAFVSGIRRGLDSM